MSAHAILSPSGASRWLACTPSARLEQQFSDKAGTAAAEGTLAHSLGELIIRYKTKQIIKTAYEKKLAEIKADKLYEPAMFDYAEDYAVYVLEQLSTAQAHTKDALLFIEEKIDLTDYIPEGFGTGDAAVIADGVLDFTDLKYGKGVPVSAVDNKQMMLYGLGMLKKFDFLYDIHTVRMTIYQPRLDSISTFEISATDLKHWAETELKPKAELAFKGEGEFAPGVNCRFCKAAGSCKANAEFNLQLAKHDFADPKLLTDEEVSAILDRSDLFTKWLAAVEDNALFEAVTNGKKWPNYKLVEGRSNRIYTDETAVAETLKAKGLAEDKIYTKKLVGITAMEKELTKPVFNDLLGSLVIKPAGKAALVPATDKRPELNSVDAAVAEFAEHMDN